MEARLHRTLGVALLTAALTALALSAGCGGGGGGGITITGTATDAESPYGPVTDAYVYVPVPGTSQVGARQADKLAETSTDEFGRYSLPGLTTGSHAIVIEPAAGSGFAECWRQMEVGTAAVQVVNTSVLRADLAAQAVAMVLAPSRASVAPGGTALFGFALRDGQGALINRHPLGNWAVEGGVGTVVGNGAFTAGDELGTGALVCCAGGLRASAPITVTTNPLADAIHVTPAPLVFAPNETSKTLTVEDTTGGGVAWMVGESIPWMNLSAPSGVGNGTITVTVDRTLFPSGTGTGQIVFTWAGGFRNVTVTLQNS